MEYFPPKKNEEKLTGLAALAPKAVEETRKSRDDHTEGTLASLAPQAPKNPHKAVRDWIENGTPKKSDPSLADMVELLAKAHATEPATPSSVADPFALKLSEMKTMTERIPKLISSLENIIPSSSAPGHSYRVIGETIAILRLVQDITAEK